METNLILLLVIVWIAISAIIGSFGTNRKIGFIGTFFASLILSPILAMLFVLSSDKTESRKINGSEKAFFIVPIIILIGIIFYNIHQDNVWEREYYTDEIQEELTQLNNVNFSDLKNNFLDDGKRWPIHLDPDYSHYDLFSYFSLEFKNEKEFKNFKTNRINKLQIALNYYQK